MLIRVAVIFVVVSMAMRSDAQPLFSNPLAGAETYRSERGALPEARYRVRYEASTSRRGADTALTELIIDAAPDWSLTREGDRAVLRDFRLNRVFTIEGNRFTTSNGLAVLVFRVMERQNRAFLERILRETGGAAAAFDGCDADSELGVRLPEIKQSLPTRFRKRSGYIALECAEREVGGFEPSDGPTPPATFWPTVFEEMTTHPELHRRMRETQRAPARLETTHRAGGGQQTRRSFRLLSSETVTTAYPLIDGISNETAARLDLLVGPGTRRLAVDAVAGRAQGGPPTPQSWGESLSSLERREGRAAAAMLIGPTLNMFPELERDCAQAREHPVCELMQNLEAIARDDPAPRALIEIAASEQRGDAAAAIGAMKRARTSPHRDHPALGAAFALALLTFDQDAMKQAREAGLPTDASLLQARALQALPYNPAFWTDIGDRIGAQYEWPDAFLLYDVAYSLPMPEALAGNRALESKRVAIERIRRDFPDSGLPR